MANNEQRRKDALRGLQRELARRERAEKLKPLGVVLTTLLILVGIGGGIYLLTTADGSADETRAEEAMASDTVEPAALVATPVSGTALPMTRSSQLPATVSCSYEADGEAAKPLDEPRTTAVPARGTVTITLNTSLGEIPMELDRSLSPCAVNAIETMAKSNYFNDTVCHRITGGRLNVLQCGDPTGTGTGGPGFKFAGEWPVDNSELDQNTPMVYPKGSIAMANPSDPDANGSQFFLNWADSELPPQYTILGSMTDEGTATVADIATNGIEGGLSDGSPAKEVRILTATVS